MAREILVGMGRVLVSVKRIILLPDVRFMRGEELRDENFEKVVFQSVISLNIFYFYMQNRHLTI